MVIGESARFPELGRAFYERDAGRTIGALADAFERLAARGALTLEDSRVAAQHFNWLILSAPINRARPLGFLEAPDGLDAIASGGVGPLLAAYGPR